MVNIRDKGLNKFIYEIVLKKKKVQDHNKHEAPYLKPSYTYTIRYKLKKNQ